MATKVVSAQQAAPAVKRVAVIGAGMGGLSTAIALRKLAGVETVHVYDRITELSPALGGGLGFSGGAKILSKLGVDVRPVMHLLNKVQLRDNRGVVLSEASLAEVLDSDVPGGSALFKYAKEDGGDGETLLWGAVMRADLQRLLADQLPAGVLNLGYKVTGLEEKEGGVALQFDGGRNPLEDAYDLVVGADGIRSGVRRIVWGPYKPVYTGFRVYLGINTRMTGAREGLDDAMQQTLGEGVAALVITGRGNGDAPRTHVVGVILRHPDPREESWKVSNDDLRRECLGLLEGATMPQDIKDLVATSDRLLCLGIHQHEPLHPWSKWGGRVALLGDAAHATSPFMAQGANQAVIDAYCLADRVKGLNEGRFKSLQEAMESYEATRKPVTAGIVENSFKVGTVVTATGPWAKLRNLGARLFPKTLVRLVASAAVPVV